MSVLFSFPGQGAQVPGMLHALPDHAEVRRTLKETSDTLGQDPRQLDTPQALQSTVAVQLCLLVAGVAVARTLMAENAGPDMVAGLSIGAYPAAVIAGALDYRDALRLVARRGELMEQAYPAGYGMAAINGLNRFQLEPLIARVHTTATPVYLANLNAEKYLVLAGADQALQAVMHLACDKGATAAMRLAVNVPSHTPLFDDAAKQMRLAFSQLPLRRPQLTYLSGSTARACFEPAHIADDLAGNMARQVHWSDTARHAWERGARLALEMPTGSTLTRLSTPLFVEGSCISCEDNRLDTLIALIARERAAS